VHIGVSGNHRRANVDARSRRGNAARHSNHGAKVAQHAGAHRAGSRGGGRRARGSKVGRTPNPSGAVARATAAFKRWQDRDVEPRLNRMRAPKPLVGAAAELGQLVAVTYRSDKYDGKTKDHEHVFKQPLASLVTDPDSQDLHIVRGRSRYAITPDGIKN
jgi:hypothetical protein